MWRASAGLTIDQAGFEAAMEEQRAPLAGSEQVRRRQSAAPRGRFAQPCSAATRRSPPRGRWWRCSRAARRSSRWPRARGRGVPRPHAVLCGSRRTGGRCGELTAAGVRFAVTDTQKRGAAHAHIGTLAEGTHPRRRHARGAGGRAQRRQATVLNHTRDAPAARGAAPGARHARAAEGLAGGA